ncbi:uncharacterized protein HaLaN_30073, partial [Haematococcus lacustris]
ARLVKGRTEQCFGFQVATKTIDEGVGAAQVAAAAGARWLDINGPGGCHAAQASQPGEADPHWGERQEDQRGPGGGTAGPHWRSSSDGARANHGAAVPPPRGLVARQRRGSRAPGAAHHRQRRRADAL